jgi:hypothetical protein
VVEDEADVIEERWTTISMSTRLEIERLAALAEAEG